MLEGEGDQHTQNEAVNEAEKEQGEKRMMFSSQS